MVEEMPEDLISNTLALEFLSENEKRQGLDDLGWLWAKQFSYSTFSSELLASLQPMSTVKARLDRFACLSKLEDSDVSIGVIKSDGRAEVFCDAVAPDGLNGIHISEWTQVMVLIDLVRSITGENWSPDEIRFKLISASAMKRAKPTRIHGSASDRPARRSSCPCRFLRPARSLVGRHKRQTRAPPWNWTGSRI
ncbi:hypothetical protein [Pseudophaeobacter leonis]|uniref:hypothetical protein n=1 Tax=Pseudophaeobacter leonis TaxID=1144477 RepID=UPI001374767A|nr:hypothetical protein [Pseudophaeobacter leonis]